MPVPASLIDRPRRARPVVGPSRGTRSQPGADVQARADGDDTPPRRSSSAASRTSGSGISRRTTPEAAADLERVPARYPARRLLQRDPERQDGDAGEDDDGADGPSLSSLTPVWNTSQGAAPGRHRSGRSPGRTSPARAIRQPIRSAGRSIGMKRCTAKRYRSGLSVFPRHDEVMLLMTRCAGCETPGAPVCTTCRFALVGRSPRPPVRGVRVRGVHRWGARRRARFEVPKPTSGRSHLAGLVVRTRSSNTAITPGSMS